MPPKTGKKTADGPGMKKTGRGARTTPKSQNKNGAAAAAAAEDTIKVDEVKGDDVAAPKRELTIEPLKIHEPVKNKTPPRAENLIQERKSDDSRSNFGKKEPVGKESIDGYEGGERLDLEDNDPEYDPEEFGGIDYDEKDIEQDHIPEGDLVEEDPEEEHEVEDGEGDSVDGEDEINEGIESGDGDVQARVECADMTDAEAGAEEEDHHDVFNERRKRKEFEVFVGGLDKDATEEDLKKVFSQVGEITEVRLMMNPQTNKNKGFAFLRFATIDQAKRACTELKNPLVNGKQCGVTPSHDSDTLFLGNICKTWTKEALKDKLKHFGVENVDLTLVEDSNDPGMNRGFAFLEFSCRADAMDAFKLLQKRDIFLGVDRSAKVSFADSFIDPGDEIMAQVKTVFVDLLPASWDEDCVRELLKQYGQVEKVELARNMPSARRKDFGFVTFDSHDAAVNCAKSINNMELGEGDRKAKVRARLSRPLQRGKGKHASRGEFHSGRGSIRSLRRPWARPTPRSIPIRRSRGIGVLGPPMKSPATFRDRRPVLVPTRSRPASTPLPRSYDRRPAPVPSYPRSRDHGRRDERAPRSRPLTDYSPRAPRDRRTSYRDEYNSRGSGYTEMPRAPSRPAARRSYVNDSYGQRYERPPPTYREGRGSDYDSLPGSKRPYSALGEIPQRYGEAGVRHTRARSDYELGSSASQYGGAYGDSSRLGRSNVGYNSSRSSVPGHDSNGLYSSRQGVSYSGGSYNSSDVGGMYSSSRYSGDYMSRSSDVGGSSYSSLYSGSGLGGSSYMGSSGSGSYY